MISFSSQIGTKTTSDDLIPFGWMGSKKRFLDSIADFERDRAEMEGRSFGHRAVAPEKQRILNRKPLAERVTLFAPEEERRSLSPHPDSLFRR